MVKMFNCIKMFNHSLYFLLLCSLFHGSYTQNKKDIRSCTFKGSVADPEDCSSYYNCVDRKLYHYHCGTQSAFDPSLKTCVSPPKNCPKAKRAGSAKNIAEDKDGGSYVCEQDGYFPDPTDCRRFYRCSKHSKHAFSCPVGLGFDSFKITCDPVENVANCDFTTKGMGISNKEPPKQRLDAGKSGPDDSNSYIMGNVEKQTSNRNTPKNGRGSEDIFYLNFDGLANFDDYISLEEAAKMDYKMPPVFEDDELYMDQYSAKNNRQMGESVFVDFIDKRLNSPLTGKQPYSMIEAKEGGPQAKYDSYVPWNNKPRNMKYPSNRKKIPAASWRQRQGKQEKFDNNMPQIQNIPTNNKKTTKKQKPKYVSEIKNVRQELVPGHKFNNDMAWQPQLLNNMQDNHGNGMAFNSMGHNHMKEYLQPKEGIMFNPYQPPRETYFPTLKKRMVSPNYISYGDKNPFHCPHDGYFKDDRDCSRFYQCTHGLPYLVKCNGGLYFNPVNKICDWPARVPGCSDRMRKVFVSSRRLRLDDDANVQSEPTEPENNKSQKNSDIPEGNRGFTPKENITSEVEQGDKGKPTKKSQTDVKSQEGDSIKNITVVKPIADANLQAKLQNAGIKHINGKHLSNDKTSALYYKKGIATIVDNDCEKEGYMRSAKNCSVFYRCTTDAKFQYVCEEGTAFHQKLKACISSEYVDDC